MKLTLSKIASSMNVLQKINAQNDTIQDIKISYWYMRNFKAIVDSYNFLQENINRLYDTYCDKGEDGQYYSLKDDKIVFNLKNPVQTEDFSKEMNELLEMECDICPYVLAFDALMSTNVKLDGDDIFVIDYMLPA